MFKYDDGELYYKENSRFNKNKGRKLKGYVMSNGYKQYTIKGKRVRAHRLIWEICIGPIPEGMSIDHINGDKLDNRIENLRLATVSQNNSNSAPKRGRKWKGTHKLPNGKYTARVGSKGAWYHLGCFDDEADAATAVNFKLYELHGEFARFNQVEQDWLVKAPTGFEPV